MMRRRPFTIAAPLLGLALSAGPVAGQLPASWTESFDPVQIADDLYYVGTAGLSSFLFTSDAGHVLIDATLEENVAGILDNVRALGFDPRDIRVHLVTHAHYDHVAGAAALVQATGAELRVAAADADFVREGRDFGFDSDGYPSAQVDREIGHLDVVSVGDLRLTAHVTPGHTPGCTSWSGTVTIDGQPRSFVLVCSLSALNVYRLGGPDPTYRGQADDFCGSAQYLATLDSEVFLSNHGQFFGLERKAQARRAGHTAAFVDPDGLTRFLDGARTSIDAARTGAGLTPCEGAGSR